MGIFFDQGYRTVMEKLALRHPLTSRVDFRDGTPEEWKEYNTERSKRILRILGAIPGAITGGALGALGGYTAARNPRVAVGAGLLGALAGGAGSSALFSNINKKEVESISDKEWAEGLKNYNRQWEKDFPDKV